MTQDSLVIIGIVLAFAAFGVVLAWGDYVTREARSTWDKIRE